jgi:hypothetical protein
MRLTAERQNKFLYVTALLVGAFLLIGTRHSFAQVPSTPTAFAETSITINSITWGWTDNSGNEDGFRVLSGTISISGNLAANTTEWQQTGLSTNTFYGPYAVQVYNASGTADSGTDSAFTAANAPISLYFTATTSGSASISWTGLTNPGGTGYNIERSTNGAAYVFIDSTTNTTYGDGSLSSDATYWYRVQAKNGDGITTAYSNTASTTTVEISTLPVAPSSFNDDAIGLNFITWGWIDSSSNEDGFRVVSGTVNISGNLAAGTTFWVQTGLSTNTVYGAYAAQAYNSSGTANSGSYSAFTAASAPTSLAFSIIYETSITVNWSANTNPGGTGYEIYHSSDVSYIYITSTTNLNYTHTGLAASTTRAYQVRAKNGDGVLSGYSNTISTSNVGGTAPAAPSLLGDDQFYLDSIVWGWFDASVNEDGFRVMSGTISLSGDLAANTTHWLQTGLSTNTQYGPYFVRSFNSTGTADSSTDTGFTVAAPASLLSVTLTSTGSIWVGWSANTNPAGTNYDVQRDSGSGYFVITTTSTTNYHDGGLSAGTTYTYRIQAKNGLNWLATYSNTDATTTVAATTLPAAPSGFSETSIYPSAITWGWADNSGNEDGFRVLSGTISISGNLAANTTHWTQVGLSTNTSSGPYSAQAYNSSGTANSGTDSAFTAAVPATSVVATTASATSASISWNIATNPGGTPFLAEVSTSAGFGVSISTLVLAASAIIPGIDGNTTYFSRVCARNQELVATTCTSGNSFTTATLYPSSPTNSSTYAMGATSIYWSWNDLSTNETGYRVLRGTINVSGDLGANTTYWLEVGLSTATDYSVNIQAFNSTGTATGLTNNRPTAAVSPGSVNVVALTSTSINVTWSANSNPPLTNYLIYTSTIPTAQPPHWTTTTTANLFTQATGLTDPSTYYIAVCGQNSLNEAACAATASIWLSSSAPNTPTGFGSAAQSPTQILWAWFDNASDETGYRVLSGTINVSGDLGANTTSWLQTGLSTNTQYGPYLVQVFNAGGTANSGSGSRYTLADAPAALIVTLVSSHTVSLAWSGTSNPGGTTYEVERSTGGGYSVIATPSAAFYNNSSLSPATTYFYQVRAKNGDNVFTSYTNTTSSTSHTAPPGPASAQPVWMTSMTVTWTSVTATGYIVQASSTNFGLGTIYQSTIAGGGSTSLNLTGLSPNTTYWVRILGLLGGISGPPAPVALLPVTRAPLVGTPNLLGIWTTTATVTWGALPPSPQPATGEGYFLEASTDSAFTGVVYSSLTPNIGLSTLTVAGLQPSSSYYFRVGAVNWLLQPHPVPVPGVHQTAFVAGTPTAPSGFAGIAQSLTSILWSWTDLSIDEAGFRVLSGTVNISGDLGAGTTMWLQTNLSTNTVYGPYQVQAYNVLGTSNSNAASRSTLADAPATLNVTGRSSLTLSIAWSAQTNPGASGYRVERDSGPGFGLLTTVFVTNHTDTLLTPNTTYSYRVQAVNADAITTTFSNTVSTPTLPPQPDAAPSGFYGSAISSNAIVWLWLDNASNEDGYRVLSGTNNISGDLGAASNNWTQTLLSPNTLYGPYTVEVFTAGGTLQSGASSAWTFAAPPTLLNISASSSHSVSIAWNANGNPGGTSYRIEVDTGAGFGFVTSIAATAYLHNFLNNATTYTYRVQAMNTVLTTTTYSNSASTITLLGPTPPQAPTGFTGTGAGVSTILWSWIDVPDDAGYRVLSGTISLSGDLVQDTTTWLQVGVSTNGLRGPYAVQAFNSSGTTLSGTASGYSLAAIPTTLSIVGITSSAITTTWSPNSNPVGTFYEVQVDSGAGFIFAGTTTLSTFVHSGLAGVSTYTYRVRALNGGSLPTAFTGSISTRTLPGSPLSASGFAGLAQSSTSVNWNWTDNATTEDQFTVRNSSGAVSPVLPANTTSWRQTGLTPNTLIGLQWARAANAAGTADSNSASRYTLAAVPVLSIGGVSSFTITLSWTANGNVAATFYELQCDSGTGFTTVYSSYTPLSYTDLPLTPSTTYNYRVRAQNVDGLWSAYSLIATTTTLGTVPDAPGTPFGLSPTTATLLWVWGPPAGAISYQIYPASAPGTLIGTSPNTSFYQTGLPPNTTHSVVVAGVNANGPGALSVAGSGLATLARPPTTTASIGVWRTSAAVQWNSNSNPAGTIAQAQKSTDNVVFSPIYQGVGTSFTDHSLLGCTSTYYRVRHLNHGGLASPFDTTLTVFTQAPVPLPPGALSAQSLTGRRIQLTWTPAPFTGISSYTIYYDSATGTIDYGTPYMVVAASSTQFTTPALSSGFTYKFAVRATHSCGIEETNTSVVAQATALDSLNGVRARIKTPNAGKKISGNRVLVSAELTSGSPGQTQQILFQYKPSSSAVWSNIVAANLNHPNPDLSAPYFVHWDVTALANGNYDLRAVATDIFSSTDGSPDIVTVSIDSVNFEVREISLGGGRVQKDQKVHKEVANQVEAADEGTSQKTELTIPAGALDQSSMTVTVVNKPAGAPATGINIQDAGLTTSITLSNSQTDLAGGQVATIVIHYPDDNDDGIVDGTQVLATTLKLYTYNAAQGKWVIEFPSVVNTASKTVTGITPHFSFFGAFAPTHADLSTVRVYPNPYRPTDGNTDTGVTFAAGNVNSGVIFDQIPGNTTITIYTITGQLVAEMTDGATGRVQWDARNDQGRDVATGLYLAVIKSPGQAAAVRKILVIR